MADLRTNAGDDGLFPSEREFRAGVRRSDPEIDVSDADLVITADTDGTAYALDPTDGAIYWETNFASSVEVQNTATTVVNDTAYIGASNGNVYALDIGNGAEEWSYSTGLGFESSVTVVDGVAYFATDDVYALDVGNQSLKWSKTTSDSNATPRVDSSVVYTQDDGDNAYALNASDGSEKWSQSLSDSDVSPNTDASTVFYPANTALEAREKSGGASDYSISPSPDETPTPPIVVNGNLYFTSFSKLYSVDASTGSTNWTFGPSTLTESFGAPMVYDGTVYYTDLTRLFAVDIASQSELWRDTPAFDLYTTPTVGDGRLYMGDGDGTFRAYDPANGDVLWSTSLNANANPSPSYVSGGDGIGTRTKQKALGHI